MFTHFFIDRPILSAVISILIVLGGAVSLSVSPPALSASRKGCR